jgi:hypothetical protein
MRLFAIPLTNESHLGDMKQASKKMKLFGSKDIPTINDIGQGYIGNCYLLSTLSSFA